MNNSGHYDIYQSTARSQQSPHFDILIGFIGNGEENCPSHKNSVIVQDKAMIDGDFFNAMFGGLAILDVLLLPSYLSACHLKRLGIVWRKSGKPFVQLLRRS